MTVNAEALALDQQVLSGSHPALPLDMDGLARILFGHSAFQQLNAACELGLFELLDEKPGLSRAQIATALELASRANDILLLGATALGLVTRITDCYSLSKVVGELIKTPDWPRFKAAVAFEHYIAYQGQHDFTESLRTNTNVGLRHIPGSGRDLYHRLAENDELEQVFYRHMRAWSELANRHLVEMVDFSGSGRLIDCGGGDAVNAIALAEANEHLHITVLEIGSVVTLAESRISEAGLSGRVKVMAADIHEDQFPEGFDTILFAHQLVIWDREVNIRLLSKAYRALPPGGRVIIFNSMSSDEGDGPVVAALDSVYFAALPAEGGMIYSWSQHEEFLREAGFRSFERIPLPGWTPRGVIVATKSV